MGLTLNCIDFIVRYVNGKKNWIGLGPIWHIFFSDPVSITLYKTIPEPFSQLAKSSFVFNAGNWWLSQISWLTDATNHKKCFSCMWKKKKLIQIQSSKICPNISDTVNSSRPSEKTSFYFLIFLELTKKFPPLLFGWKNFEREQSWDENSSKSQFVLSIIS